MSCDVKTLNFKMPCYKNEGCYWTLNLQNEMDLGCSITKESWKLRGSAILHFEIYMTSHENKECGPSGRQITHIYQTVLWDRGKYVFTWCQMSIKQVLVVHLLHSTRSWMPFECWWYNSLMCVIYESCVFKYPSNVSDIQSNLRLRPPLVSNYLSSQFSRKPKSNPSLITTFGAPCKQTLLVSDCDHF